MSFLVLVVFIISWVGIIDIRTAYRMAELILVSFLYGFISLKRTGRKICLSTLGGFIYMLVGFSLVFIRIIIK